MEISHVVGTEVVVVPILVVLDHLVNQGPPTPGKVDPGGGFFVRWPRVGRMSRTPKTLPKRLDDTREATRPKWPKPLCGHLLRVIRRTAKGSCG